jgi:hypothetical protein
MNWPCAIWEIFWARRLAIPAERGEPRSFSSLPRKVPSSAVIRNQRLTRRGSNCSGASLPKKKVAGKVAAFADDKQKFIAFPEYQIGRYLASWTVGVSS